MEDDATFPDSGNLSFKVISVSAGESHTLALTGDGCVYSWGRGMFGRLGTGSESDELLPVPVSFNFPGKSKGEKLKIVAIATGSYHSLALADDGSVWSWGYNTYGQLGMNGEKSVVPLLMEPFLELGTPASLTNKSEMDGKTPLKVSSIKGGGMMSLAIDNLGSLWIWGNIPQQSGENDLNVSLTSIFTPVPIWDFHGHTVVNVACGNEHIIALVSAGETSKGDDLVCYSWGNNSHGQLGLGDKVSRLRPQVIETFNQDSPWSVYEIACGAFHTALLTRKKRPNEILQSTCWTFGQGDNGQLGHGTTQSLLVPEPLKELPERVYLTSVDCGLFHTSVVSSAGDVWSWGMEKGLGLCPDASYYGTDSGDAISPLLISPSHGPKFRDPVQITCGAAHTVLVAHEGYKLWSWGRGRSGVLGNGKEKDSYVPSIVLWPPLEGDFENAELKTRTHKDKTVNVESEGTAETDNRLSMATKEIKLLQSKLSVMEKYCSMLHGSVFGKAFEEKDLPTSGSFDIAREWENMLESADRNQLMRLEGFYRHMLAGVKDKLMKKRIQELIIECLPSSTAGR